jgi:hypothetical protein
MNLCPCQSGRSRLRRARWKTTSAPGKRTVFTKLRTSIPVGRMAARRRACQTPSSNTYSAIRPHVTRAPVVSVGAMVANVKSKTHRNIQQTRASLIDRRLRSSTGGASTNETLVTDPTSDGAIDVLTAPQSSPAGSRARDLRRSSNLVVRNRSTLELGPSQRNRRCGTAARSSDQCGFLVPAAGTPSRTRSVSDRSCTRVPSTAAVRGGGPSGTGTRIRRAVLAPVPLPKRSDDQAVAIPTVSDCRRTGRPGATSGPRPRER